MTITQLEYVLAVFDTGSFSKAAKKCFVTQPNLSMQILKLEDELGIKIFDRDKGGNRVTTPGQQLIEHARNIVRERDGLIERIRSEKQDLSGTYKIGVIPTLAPYIVPLFLSDFTTDYPSTHLSIEELQTDSIIEYLENDYLDVGIAVTPLEEKGLKEIPVFNEPIYAYISPSHPFQEKELIDPDWLKSTDVWYLNQGHCFRDQVLEICNQDKDQAAKKSSVRVVKT